MEDSNIIRDSTVWNRPEEVESREPPEWTGIVQESFTEEVNLKKRVPAGPMSNEQCVQMCL